MSEEHYKELLKASKREFGNKSNSSFRKKRKINKDKKIELEEPISENISNDASENAEDSFDSDDFEDVDLEAEHNYDFAGEKNTKDDSITINITRQEGQPKKTKPRVKIVSADERKYRKLYHQLYLITMILHGSIRNKWCNDYPLLMSLKRIVPQHVFELIYQDTTNKVLSKVRSRRFLDGINILMELYSKKFRVSSKGLIRKNWNELSIMQPRADKNVTCKRFKELVNGFTGSRDIGAQGFLCLLRSIGLQARLVFSLQPPDFTSTSEYPKIDLKRNIQSKVEESKKNPPVLRSRKIDSKSRILAIARDKLNQDSSEAPPKYAFEDAPFPIFWVEVWDKYVKKWVSIDPIVLKVIEISPMRRKSKFEPPLSEPRNQLSYVIAYDRLGAVKDVTRRYSQFYNARTIKKKIHFKSEEDENWYHNLLKVLSTSLRKNKLSKLDILELKEFHDRDLAEGIPNNLSDFKNHPMYALEMQLKQNEVIFPKDDSSKCGMFRNKSFGKASKTGQEVFIVFKRSHVHTLKSAKAWYMRGRVLKVGVQPLKIKRKTLSTSSYSNSYGDDEEEEEDYDEESTRLYAEFQTQLYLPPPIVDGKIPKNSYGNIDVYTPTMIPENGYLVDTTKKYSMRMAERAAKSILNIDYAKAIISFDFGDKSGKKGRHNRVPTAKEGGLLIDIQYKDGMIAVLDALVEEERELQREQVQLNSLQNWRFFLTKLRISERLNREHGKLEKQIVDSDIGDSFSDDARVSDSGMELSSVDNANWKDTAKRLRNKSRISYSESDFEGDSDDFEGGFFPEKSKAGVAESNFDSRNNSPEFGGGFLAEDGLSDKGEDKFEMEENELNGGFLTEDRSDGALKRDFDSELKSNVNLLFSDSNEVHIKKDPDEDQSDNDMKDFGGGFLVKETAPESKGPFSNMAATNTSEHQQKNSSDIELFEEIPEDYFRLDDNNNLIYDPHNDDKYAPSSITPKQQSYDSKTFEGEVKKATNIEWTSPKAEILSVEPPELSQKLEPHQSNNDKSSKAHMANTTDEDIDYRSAIDEEIDTSNSLSSNELHSLVEEEKVFGFEYSDSD